MVVSDLQSSECRSGQRSLPHHLARGLVPARRHGESHSTVPGASHSARQAHWHYRLADWGFHWPTRLATLAAAGL